MIGSLVLQHCLDSEDVASVVSLVRRASGVLHEKLEEVVVNDFSQLDENASCFEAVDIVYYCLGVYTGAVDAETFHRITIDYPEILARILIGKNSEVTFCLLSGAGADRNERSRMMFARDKGTIENRLSRMGFKDFHTFGPGYIYPVDSRNEPNFSYRVFRWLYPVIRLLGNNASIRSTELAQVMFNVGLSSCQLEILENRDIMEQVK